jgi:L-lactate dehydrogenase (cytochrome)
MTSWRPRPLNVDEWRSAARRRLPAPLFHYLDGGADDEWTLSRNKAAFADYPLRPRALVDVGAIDVRTRLLGADVAMPLLLSPTGMSRLFHHGREIAVARAAAGAGVFYSLSTLGTTRIEDVAAASTGPKLFQVYVFRDRGLTRELLDRCRAAGYQGVALTVDTPLAGNRERDRRTGMTIPPRFTATSLLSFAAHPRWLLRYLTDRRFELANVAHRVDAQVPRAMSVIDYVNSQFDRTITWDDAAWLVREWGGKVAIKGLLHPADVRRAAEIGAHAVFLSNHGGRQLDFACAPIDALTPARDAVGDALELIVDGGVRRGTDVLKALCLGANACSIGRPYLYGLAAAGEQGVGAVLATLREELERGMALLGCRSLAELGRDRVEIAGKPTRGTHDDRR